LTAFSQAGKQADTLRGKNPGRNWLAETGTQAERDRLTCSNRQRATGEGRKAGRGHGGRQAKPEAAYEGKHVGDKVI
jgi:hypothetical protein